MTPSKPNRMKRGPGKLASLFNALRDFVIRRDILIGDGLLENETVNGRKVTVSKALLDLEKIFNEQRSGVENGGGGTITNVFGGDGTGDGTGLPDVTENPTTGIPEIDGQPLGWQLLNVCVDDGVGGWTPMVIKQYSSAPYIPA